MFDRGMTWAVVTLLGAARLAARAQTSEHIAPNQNCPTGDSTTSGLGAQIDLSGGVTRATVRGKTFSGDLKLIDNINPTACGFSRQRVYTELLSNYDEKKKNSDSPAITRSHVAALQYLDFFPANRIFWSFNGRLFHNSSLDVYLQQIYDLSIGTTIDASVVSIEVEAGPAFVGQHFTSGETSTGYGAAKVAESITLSVPFIKTGTELTEIARFAIPVSRHNPNQTWATAAVRVPASKYVSFVWTAYDDFVSNSPAGFQKWYLTTSVSLSLKVGWLAG